MNKKIIFFAVTVFAGSIQNIQASVTTEQLVSGVAKAKKLGSNENRDALGYSNTGDPFCDAYRNQAKWNGPGNPLGEPENPAFFATKETSSTCPAHAKEAAAAVRYMRENHITFAEIERSLEGANRGHDNSNRNIKFPSKEILRASFYKEGLGHFISNAHIENIIDNKEIRPSGVALIVDLAVEDYIEGMKKDRTPEQAKIVILSMLEKKQRILEILLQSDPAALKELKDNGISFDMPTQKKNGLLDAISSKVVDVVTSKLPIQRIQAASVSVGALPIAMPGVSLPIRGQGFFEDGELDLVERELADRLQEERTREAKEEERKKKEKATIASPAPAQMVSNSTNNFLHRAAQAQDLRLQEARFQVEQLFAQLKKDSEKEEQANKNAQDAATNARVQVMQQLTTLRNETTQLLEATRSSGGSNSSNGSGGSSSSRDRDHEHGGDRGGSDRYSSGSSSSHRGGGSICLSSSCACSGGNHDRGGGSEHNSGIGNR